MIFAREISDDLTSLVKEINAQVLINKDKKMAAFTVVLTQDTILATYPSPSYDATFMPLNASTIETVNGTVLRAELRLQ